MSRYNFNYHHIVLLILVIAAVIVSIVQMSDSNASNEPYDASDCGCVNGLPLFGVPGVPYNQLRPGRLTPETQLAYFPPVVPLSSFL
jgi:hypothetical protein